MHFFQDILGDGLQNLRVLEQLVKSDVTQGDQCLDYLDLAHPYTEQVMLLI